MFACYVDESGDLGAVSAPPKPNDQPVFLMTALLTPVACLGPVTTEFLSIKARFFPNLNYPSALFPDKILGEIKGSDVRHNALQGNARQKSHAIGFLDQIVGLLERHQMKLMSRVWVKRPGDGFNGTSVYTSSLQALTHSFDVFLQENDTVGFCIVDGRNKPKNVNASHSIFTKKFGAAAPSYGRLLELPTFGHSDNHALIQICDLVASSLLYPIACFAYCTGHVANVHVQPNANDLRTRYGQKIRDLQFRHYDGAKWRGGVTVSDAISGQHAGAMFR